MRRATVEVAPGVLITTSRRDLTNSTMLISDGGVVLIDPAWDPDELDDLADWLAQARMRPVAGFATHAHYDHMLWHPDFGDVPRWASPAAAEIAATHRTEMPAGLGPNWPARLAPYVGMVLPLQAKTISWPDGTGPVNEIVVHDGHSTGHASVWLEDSGVLIAGDMLSDVELPLAQETGLEAYDRALTMLEPYSAEATALIPGHGRPTRTPMTRWTADRRYLDAVLAGRAIEDPRLRNDGMRQAHEANLAANF